MRYSYEFKMKCIEMYRKGETPDTPEGITRKQFVKYIRYWVRTLDAQGPEALRHKTLILSILISPKMLIIF